MIGIYLDNFNVPWMEYVYRLAEKTDTVLFTNNYGNVDVHSNICVLSSSYIWNFPHTIIATDTFSACYLVDCPIPTRKLMYINGIDWNKNFRAIDTVKAHSMELITEPGLVATVNSVWGPAHIVRNWNYESLRRILGI